MNRCLRWKPVEDFRIFFPPPSPTRMISPVGSTISKDMTRSRVCPKRVPSRREPAARDPTSDEGAGVRRGRVREEHAVLLELLVELQHADARADRDRPVREVDLVDLVHSLDVDEDASAQGDSAVVEPRASRPRNDRDPGEVGQLDDLRDLLRRPGQDDDSGQVLCPAVDREGRGDPGPVRAARQTRQHGAGLVHDRLELRDHARVHRHDGRGGHGAVSRSDAPRRPPMSIPADSATSSMMSATSMPTW